MMSDRRSAWARVGLVLFVLVFAGMACSLSGGDSEKESDTQPTVAATITPPLTRTPIPTFTPFPTLTPGQPFQPVPTATRIAFNPTAVPQVPTWTPVQATAYPYDVRISYPVDGSQIAGYITIVGSASHPRFLQYALEWGPDPNPGNLWYPITAPQINPVINGGLGAWNTTTMQDGVYQVRLHVWLNDGTDTFDIATGIRISNQQPTAVPTLTQTPKPNQAPTINPIPSQQVQAGQSINIGVTAGDPDGDAVNLFVASSNTSIASAQVTGPTQITVAGVTAGAATITVTANDNRGGLTSTAFIVTVQGQNQAPTISPIVQQAVKVGQTADVALSVSDPDGDTLTVTATSNNTAIVSANAASASLVQLLGVGVGTANVTVSASDNKGGVIKTTFQVVVGEPNRPPTINAIPAQTMSVGDSLSVTYVAADPDGDTLSAKAVSDTPGVATASVTAPGVIMLNAVSQGPATVTLSVEDGINPATIATFPVTVVAGNVAPTIDPLSPQTMSVGETRDVPYNAVDPESDTLTASASSDTPGVVTASVSTPGTITLNGVSAGTATVTLTVNDGQNPAVSAAFTVSVASVNLPPVVETIFPQTLSVGKSLDVAYAATDPDGDTLTALAASDTPGVVTASVSAPGTIALNAVAAGSATVTLTVDDGQNPAVTMPFTVTVVSNAPPTVSSLAPVTMNPGDTLDVGYTASDPEGDPLTETAASDTPGVVTASINTPGTITLNAVGPGVATVSLNVNDGINPTVTTTFTATVQLLNQPPSIDPIAPQALNVGDTVPVAYTASDPDGDPLTETASSDTPGVVTASVSAPGTITLSAVAAGTATITLTVEDGTNPAVSVSFQVSVNMPNQSPVLDPIGPQVLTVGDSLNVAYVVFDLEGDPLTASAVSDTTGVVTASVSSPGVITLNGVMAGAATVTLTVDDGTNPAVSTSFQVTVSAANQPPAVDPIGSQVLTVGDTLNVPYTATDPESDPLSAKAASDTPGVVAANISAPGTITLNAVAAGSAMVTLTVEDGNNPAVSISFQVTVNAPNANPMIQPIADQSVDVGATINVPVVVTDPDGDVITLMAVSNNPAVATAMANGPAEVVVGGVTPGTATVTVDADDGKGGVATVQFLVTVVGVNNAPVFQPIGDQALTVGEQIAVPVSVSDPDGDTITLTAISQNNGVVIAEAVGTDTVNLQGVAEGTVSVDLTADDAKGGVTTVSFAVNVSSAQPGFNVMDYPVVPQIPQPMAASLQQIYNSGITNFGNQPRAFSKVGDNAMDSPNFLAPFTGGTYELGGFGSLQATVDFYNGGSVRASDPAITAFNVDSIAAGADFGIDALASPPSEPECPGIGASTRLACEFQLTKPAVALISFSATNVTYLPPEQFRAELQSLVAESLSNYGVIPVLATIPAGGGSSLEQLAPYNQVIVEVATQSGINGVPLWNLARAMQERGIGDPNSVAPEGPAVLTDPALNYGFNMRNLTALQSLQAVRDAVGIN